MASKITNFKLKKVHVLIFDSITQNPTRTSKVTDFPNCAPFIASWQKQYDEHTLAKYCKSILKYKSLQIQIFRLNLELISF